MLINTGTLPQGRITHAQLAALIPRTMAASRVEKTRRRPSRPEQFVQRHVPKPGCISNLSSSLGPGPSSLC